MFRARRAIGMSWFDPVDSGGRFSPVGDAGADFCERLVRLLPGRNPTRCKAGREDAFGARRGRSVS